MGIDTCGVVALPAGDGGKPQSPKAAKRPGKGKGKK